MITDAARALWAEPRAPQPPARVWRDWVLVAAVACAGIVEIVARPDLPWRPIGVLEIAVLAVALLGRRTHPLAAVALGFGTVMAVDVASFLAGASGSPSPDTTVFLLVLVYALFRWGAGREAVVGIGIAAAAATVGIARDQTALLDALVGCVVLTLPALFGASVRLWTTSRETELDQVRLREREQLARELHDTVAHHVSAMVIRAQAGRVTAGTRPAAAIEALEIIEAEGSRTLAEMRTMVGALRDNSALSLAPTSGLADVARLARAPEDGPAVEVTVSGDCDDVGPSVGAAIYRIAQEGVTNATRHARNATRIEVLVTADGQHVRLCVRDDGEPVSAPRALDGFGLVGMAERATLLGGTLEAGPAPSRGWVVDAVLPRLAASE